MLSSQPSAFTQYVHVVQGPENASHHSCAQILCIAAAGLRNCLTFAVQASGSDMICGSCTVNQLIISDDMTYKRLSARWRCFLHMDSSVRTNHSSSTLEPNKQCAYFFSAHIICSIRLSNRALAYLDTLLRNH